MKFQPRRFVVEVKRGTSRAAFASPDTVSDKFSNAEDLLFGTPPKPAMIRPKATSAAMAGGERRILESLIELPPPPVEDVVERPRRGRKPGSKNKPKPVATPTSAPAIIAAEVPPTLKRVPSASSFRRAAIALDESSWEAGADTAATPPAPSSTPRTVEADSADDGQVRRTRLRDRSSILKRYVLETEPRPGQFGYLRSRRGG